MSQRWLLGCGLALALAGALANELDIAAMRELAAAQLYRSDYDAAVETYQQIRTLAPEDPRSHADLAGVLGFVRRYQEAVEPIRAAIRMQPGKVEHYVAAALIFTNAGLSSEAFQATEKAAELGEVTAMYELVWMHQRGIGTPTDSALAFTWARRAATAGHVGAMSLLVDAYMNGDFGQPVDMERAEYWSLRVLDESRRFADE